MFKLRRLAAGRRERTAAERQAQIRRRAFCLGRSRLPFSACPRLRLPPSHLSPRISLPTPRLRQVSASISPPFSPSVSAAAAAAPTDSDCPFCLSPPADTASPFMWLKSGDASRHYSLSNCQREIARALMNWTRERSLYFTFSSERDFSGDGLSVLVFLCYSCRSRRKGEQLFYFYQIVLLGLVG